ncbi:MAG: BREX-2 system adenine-specific DNA-methyltransferase PglX [Myxococcales bacterium]|nr:BREX-2 system adenine-specific DNA-methyltransferase PglX [Myxococcales bacterium]
MNEMAKTNARKKKTLTLTQALASFLSRVLLPDLKERAEQGGVKAALQRQHAAEVEGKRTADGFLEWQARTLEQVGAAWVLSCVFVRTLEDRGLLGQRRLAGPGAGDSEQLFFELAPSLTARDYLLEVFREVGSLPGAEELFGARHNPVWRLSPSNEAARKLLEFFREPGEAGEGLAWEFAGGDTRFLGDLYQDLSEEVRKRYALLQTPDFVERFILDQTLEPAIAEFGLKEVRVIDPTCGSGHFLLGAFDRLVDHRLRVEPGIDVRTHAAAALEQVYGVDVNPYAVAIARFRLTLAYLEKAGITKLAQAPKLPLNLVVADSLLHGGKGREMLLVEQDSGQIDHAAWGTEMFALDDPLGARKVFRQRYHAVVGNPPYITCKDSALREVYRAAYRSAAGKYALAAPFTERFFELASDGGFVGLINANSFMKREFGKQLIEEVLPRLDLTRVIDTSGAYIPGHGTPTVLLFGRNQKPSSSSVNAVLGKRGEPSTPEDAEQGFVWRSIAEHGAEVGFENEYVSVAAVGRETLNAHPWSLGGGGAAELKELLEDRTATTLGDIAGSIGIASFTLEDDAFLATADVFRRNRVPEEHTREMMIGESIRDWGVGECPVAFFPYDSDLRPIKDEELALRYLWPYRTNLANNKLFGGKTKVEGGLRWYEYGRLTTDKLRTPLSIAFAEVATHNHFVLDRGGKVFKQTAPIIKLPESATEDDHLALLAYLNSSTACFWMKQVCYPKGGDHMGDGGRLSATKWQDRYALASNAIKPLPVPDLSGFAPFGAKMLALVEERNALLSALAVAAPAADWGDLVARAEEDDRRLLEKMVVLQEQLDWYTYRAFGLSEAVRRRACMGRVAWPTTIRVPGLGANIGRRPRCSMVCEKRLLSAPEGFASRHASPGRVYKELNRAFPDRDDGL